MILYLVLRSRSKANGKLSCHNRGKLLKSFDILFNKLNNHICTHEKHICTFSETCLRVNDLELSDGNSSTCIAQSPTQDYIVAEWVARIPAHNDCFVDNMIAINITLGIIHTLQHIFGNFSTINLPSVIYQ